MSINLYGNVNGTYQPPSIDVFALAKAQNNKPVMFKDTEAGKNMPAVKVNISAEGLRALKLSRRECGMHRNINRWKASEVGWQENFSRERRIFGLKNLMVR